MQLSVSWYFSLHNSTQEMNCCLLLVVMAEFPSQLMPSAGDLLLCLLLFVSPSFSKELLTSQAHTYSLCGKSSERGNLLAHPVTCCPVPGTMEKGKAMALRCTWTILQTWGSARRHTQFSSNLMPWLTQFSQRKLIKYSFSPLQYEFPIVASQIVFQLSA